LVHLEYFLLAEAAAAVEGKHYIHGAGWDTLTAPAFPTVHPLLSLAIRFWVDNKDAGRAYRIEADLLDVATGQQIGSKVSGDSMIQKAPPPGERAYVTMVINLQMTTFPHPGEYKIRFFVDNVEIASQKLQLVQGGQAPSVVNAPSKPNA
jgi:hypothetical protein